MCAHRHVTCHHWTSSSVSGYFLPQLSNTSCFFRSLTEQQLPPTQGSQDRFEYKQTDLECVFPGRLINHPQLRHF